MLCFCVDRSEQRHHVAGRLGAALLAGLSESGWVTRRPRQRAVDLASTGAHELQDRIGLVRDSG